ncbi:MAG: PDZ domain-containing protein [Clostridia bacterium]|nr:PDZ domain-containing protein [Clostridia bacterium]
MKHTAKRLTALLPLLIIVLSLLFAPAALANTTISDLQTAKIYARLYSFYGSNEEIESAKDMASLVAALAKIDPYSHYLSAAELAAFDQSFDPNYTGIGVALEKNAAGEVVIKAVYANSPAATAGFLRGDIMYSVDGKPTAGKAPDEVAAMLRGEKRQLLTVEIKRNGYVVKYEMQRKDMAAPSIVYWMLDQNTAYVLIERFNVPTGQEISAAMEYLTGLGMKSLLLDLRDCPGGVMQAAGMTAGILGEDGPIYFNVGRDGYESFYNSKDHSPCDIPIAVLVNEQTASAAEMLAAVLQDTHRAMIIGSPTYGKGVFQSMLVLPSGAGLYFTTGKYVTRGFQDISELHGVTPDLLVRDAAAQQTQALAWLDKQQALAKNFVFTLGSYNAQADGAAFSLSHRPFSSNGSSYLPANETLKKMGWELHYYQNCWYGFNGTRRIIIDTAGKEAVSGNKSTAILISANTAYLPASFFRNLGYSVSWDGASQAITVSR